MKNEIDKTRIAKLSTRFGAYITDFIIISLITIPLNYLNIVHLKSFMIYFIVALVAILYKPLLEYFFGATVGKYALDIKVSNANLEKITLTQSFKRSSILLIAPVLYIPIYYLAFNNPRLIEMSSFMEFSQGIQVQYPLQIFIGYISFAILVADLIIMLTDDKKLLRSLHDRIGQTYVLKSR